MGLTKYDEEIKCRVTSELKQKVADEAGARGLDVSDIVREALRRFFARRLPRPVPHGSARR